MRITPGIDPRRLRILAPLALVFLAPAIIFSPGSTPGAAAAAAVGVTIDAPGAGDHAKVTVSRNDDLVNQTVAVTWSGFRPSSATRLDNAGDSVDINTENPVRVYQCRGADPKSSSDCYGSPGFRGIDASGDSPAIPAVPAFTYPGQQDAYNATPDGPANWQDAVTAPDGTGEVAVQIFTKRESAALGCDVDSPCSVVVVPNYGRPQGATEDLMDAPWAWNRRTVVPLTFLPVGDACPLTGTSLAVEGSPVAARALASWRARTCTLPSAAVRVDYTSIGEPQTREDLAGGVTNVGLTIDPLGKASAAGRGVVYAPVAVTGLVVAYQVDDAKGRPVRNLKLNARLVAKLITASYRSGPDPAVAGNPVNIFRDPEFLKLNPGIDWPSGAPGNHPLILGDLSDTTLALTRWLRADKEASAFIAGKADPWGMKVNAHYKDVKLPFASFPLLDQMLSDSFQPIQEMDTLARQLSIAQFPGSITTDEGGVNVVTKPPRQNPGRREVIGIIDAASAANFRLSTAALENAAGKFVQPDDAGLSAGIAHSTLGNDGVTRTVDLTSKDPKVYPLSVLVTAGLSTQADQPTRKAMANLLSFVAGAGQKSGAEIGELPAGYAPLSSDLRKQVAAARTAVLTGYVAPPATQTDPTSGGGGGGTPGSGTPSGGDAPASSGPVTAVAPGGDDTVSDSDVRLAASALTISSHPPDGRNWLLPISGLLGLLLLVAGPAIFLVSRSERGPQWLRR